LSSPRAANRWFTQVHGLYQRFKQLIHEGAKFGIVGLTGIAITDLLFVPLHGTLHLGPLTAITIATAAATVFAFFGNRYWSFKHRQGAGTGRESALFFALNGVGLLIQYAVLGLTNYGLGLTSKEDNFIAVNVGIVLGTLFRFWSYRKFVWVPPEVRQAQLNRGRHRMGRTVVVLPPERPVTEAARRPVAEVTAELTSTQERARQRLR
jgi:putative flippase GtrA